MDPRHRAARVSALGLAAVVTAGCSSSDGSNDNGSAAPTTPTRTVRSSTPTTPTASPSESHPPSSPPPTSGGTLPGPEGGPVPADFTPSSVTFVSAEAGWVLGTAPCSSAPCTSIVRTRDGGRSWMGVPAPRAPLGGDGQAAVSVVRFANGYDGWAGVGGLYATHDGGVTWHAQQVGPANTVVTSVEAGGGYVYAAARPCAPAGGRCSPKLSVYGSPVHADDWQTLASGLNSGNGWTGLVVHDADWFLPTAAGIYSGHGLGSAHRLANPCSGGSGLPAAVPVTAAPDAVHLDALCTLGAAAGSSRYQLYGTTDAGAHWAKAGGPHLEASGLFGITDNGDGVLLAATASGSSQIIRSTDDGGTFEQAALSAPAGGVPWADLGFTTSRQAVAVLRGTALYLSRDAGASFSAVSF